MELIFLWQIIGATDITNLRRYGKA